MEAGSSCSTVDYLCQHSLAVTQARPAPNTEPTELSLWSQRVGARTHTGEHPRWPIETPSTAGLSCLSTRQWPCMDTFEELYARSGEFSQGLCSYMQQQYLLMTVVPAAGGLGSGRGQTAQLHSWSSSFYQRHFNCTAARLPCR